VPKFTFTCEDNQLPVTDYARNTKVTVEFEALSLREVLPQIEYFLKGSGYHFDGVLDFHEE
jgi:hypothetical protein